MCDRANVVASRPAYTISRAILSDAIALTRGDRFYTADYTPFNMTAWGFADCQRDASGPGCGSMLGRLLLRTLPDEFPPDLALGDRAEKFEGGTTASQQESVESSGEKRSNGK